MPLKPVDGGKSPASPRFDSSPSSPIAKIPTLPVPEFKLYRNLLSAEIAMSRLVLPAGFTPAMVPPIGVSDPLLPIAKPLIVADPAFDAYTHLPFGVMAFQQFAAPRVGIPRVIADTAPVAETA